MILNRPSNHEKFRYLVAATIPVTAAAAPTRAAALPSRVAVPLSPLSINRKKLCRKNSKWSSSVISLSNPTQKIA